MQSILIQNINSSELENLISKAVAAALKDLSINAPVVNSVESTSSELLTKGQAASYLKISLPTLSKYIKNGFVKAHTVAGTRMRFRVADLEKALKMLHQSK